MPVTTTKPTPGKQYTVQVGDTLKSMAESAYGIGTKQDLIRDVNQTQIKFDDVEDIAAGTVILIPVDTENAEIRAAQLQRGLT